MTNSINVWLDHLRVLCPPSGVMLVGAGAGTSNWVQRLAQWEAPNVTLVEADEAQFQHLQRTAPKRGDWRLHKHVISSATESVNFHQASNSAESGLVEPEALQSLWPNIKTRKTQARQAITLADLQQDAETPANWLMVDCLPALAIIQGGADQLSAFDLIAVRVLLEGSTLPQGMASQGEVQTFLEALGFQCLASEAGRHPALGHALFLRDSQAVTRQLHQKLDQHAEVYLAQAQQLTGVQAANLALTTQIQQLKDALEQTKTETAATALNLAEERSVLAQQLSQANAVAEKLTRELQLQIEELKRTHDQTVQQLTAETEQLKGSVQTDSAAWSQARAELTQTRDNASKLAAERQIQIEQLKQAAEQATAKANVSAAAAVVAAKQIEERATQVQQLSQAKAATDKLAADRHLQFEELKRTQAQAVQALQAQLEQITATTQSNRAAWASEKLGLTQALEKADRLTKESQLQIEHHKQAAEQATLKVNAAAAAAVVAVKQAEQCTTQVQQLSQAKAAADKLAADRQLQLEELKRTQAQGVQALQAQLEQVTATTQTNSAAWASERLELTQALEKADKLTKESLLQIEHHKQAAEQATLKVNAAAAAAVVAVKQAEQRTAQVQQLSQAKAAADKLAADRQQQLEQLQQAQSQNTTTLKAEIEQIQTSLQTEKGNWAKERADLSQARTTAENLTAERHAQIQALEQRLQHLQANSAEAEARNRNAQTNSVEAEKRYSMMQNELTKAEAQMSLIKDLLLREKPR